MANKIQKEKIEAYTEQAFMKAMKRLIAQGYEVRLAIFTHRTAKEECHHHIANPSLVTLSLNQNETCPVCESKACVCSQSQML